CTRVRQLTDAAVCFLYGCDAHQDLHSFPTRRSSDLAAPTPGNRRVRKLRISFRSLVLPDSLPLSDKIPTPARDRYICRGKAWPRSEEHTSELQSLRHLVCRLLLEKKNAIQRDPRTVS